MYTQYVATGKATKKAFEEDISMKKLVTMILAIAMTLSFAAMASAGSEKTLKLATDAALEYPTTQALSKLAELCLLYTSWP